MILKPFMLRRIKKDVENELTEKLEILKYCPLTIRQKHLYNGLKRKIRIEDLLQGYGSGGSSSSNSITSSLMNLVMQFRKVCNHPELFERRDTKSPFVMKSIPYLMPKMLYQVNPLLNLKSGKYVCNQAKQCQTPFILTHFFFFISGLFYNQVNISQNHISSPCKCS